MSINDLAPFLKPLPPLNEITPEDDLLYVWVYGDRFNWKVFTDKVGGVLLGIGELENWTWHINQKGEANIRPSFLVNSDNLANYQYITPSPGNRISSWTSSTNRTYGWVIQVLRSQIEDIDRLLGRDGRIGMVKKMQTLVSRVPHHAIEVFALIYWDPRNTSNYNQDLIKDDDVEYAAWQLGVSCLRGVGVPLHFVRRVAMHVRGHFIDVEPVFICYKKTVDLDESDPEILAESPVATPARTRHVQRYREGGVVRCMKSRLNGRAVSKRGGIRASKIGERFMLQIRGIVVDGNIAQFSLPR